MKHDSHFSDLISHADPDDVADGIDRRGFLHCMAWVGTGVVFAMNGGVLASMRIGSDSQLDPMLERADSTFVQISDSHIDFQQGRRSHVATRDGPDQCIGFCF